MESKQTKQLGEIVATNIKAERLRQGITQERLASLTGCSIRFISRFESGTHNIRLDTLEKFALALHVPCSQLLHEHQFHVMGPEIADQFKLAIQTIHSVYERCFRPNVANVY